MDPETRRLVARLVDEARALQDGIVEDRRALHRIPETGMDLPETAAFVTERLDALGIGWRPAARSRPSSPGGTRSWDTPA